MNLLSACHRVSVSPASGHWTPLQQSDFVTSHRENRGGGECPRRHLKMKIKPVSRVARFKLLLTNIKRECCSCGTQSVIVKYSVIQIIK